MRRFEPDELHCVRDEFGLIGKGSFGTVLLAFHDIHNTLALKCLELFGGYNTVRRMKTNFKLELENLQCCNHENVVRILGWAHWSNTFAMVMEYLPAGNLMEVVTDRDINLPPLLQLRICSDIANGLSFIHNLSNDSCPIHGVVKPKHVLLTVDLHCKISNFRSAKLSSFIREYTAASSATPETEESLFTDFYTAPELLKSALTKPKPSMDTYSYGMLVFVVLGRKTPKVIFDLFKQSILYGDRPDLGDILNKKRVQEERGEANASNAVDALISAMRDCWSQLPEDRPTMTEIKERLLAVIADIPPDQILLCATNTLKEMKVSVPVRAQCECTPADQLCLFERKTTENFLHSIKSSLENNLTKEAVCQTDELLSTVASTDNADLIIDDVIAIARSLKEKSEYSTSVKLVGWGSYICGKIENPKVKFRKLCDCCDVVDCISSCMFDANRESDIDEYCLPILSTLHEKLKLVKINDMKLKKEKQTSCLLYIGYCNHRINKPEVAIYTANLCLTNVKFLYVDPTKHLIFSSCYRLLALASHNKGDYESAIKYWKLNIEALRSAEDIGEGEREKWIDESLRESKSCECECASKCIVS